MSGVWKSRRQFISMAGSGFIAVPALADDEIVDGKLNYRGFIVDISATRHTSNYVAIESSVKHQLDIAADCGAEPAIIDFLRGRRVALVHNLGGTPGRFISNQGIFIEANVLPQQQPIILHEMPHAYHYYVLPGGWGNSDVQQFFNRAKDHHLYPAREIHNGQTYATYLLTDVTEFFAVTASLYLWGYVDREPHNRERLKMLEPIYYDWLGRQFGVQK